MKAIFTFGRMNPVTKGHAKLVQKVLSESREGNADHFIFVSQTNASPNNPLPWEYKMRVLETIYPGVNIARDKKIKTPYQALEHLAETYSEITFIVGDDRMNNFKSMHDYAKVWGVRQFEIKSAGRRIAESKGDESASGSKARQLAREGNYKAFCELMPARLSDDIKRDIYNKIRTTEEDADNKEAEEYRRKGERGEFFYTGWG